MFVRNLPSVVRLVCLGVSLSWIPHTYAQRDLTDIPAPDPTAELAAMHVAEGYEVNLFAADPDFSKPIHMNWDASGRLWIASSNNYPQLKPGAEPTDEIIVLEDTDGDGVSDKRVVFASDMMIPTGVLPGDGGVYVANSTQLVHLADSDGDGQADLRRTILSGFGTEDTHHLLHTLRWRPDGRMAMNQSIYIHSHLETPYGVKHLDGGGIWHFDPFSSQLEVFCKGLVNPWGHAIDEFGQSLATDGAGVEGINYAFPGAVFVTSPGATRWLSGLNPGSPKHCGLEFISGGAMPEAMHDVLVTNDFRGHRVCRFKLERQGSGYRSVQLPDLIRSDHIAFRPIDVKMGPDGAIYIADWYNPIIQHGEVDFRDPRRDTEHGRIWRITAKGQVNLKRPDYAGASEAELISKLQDSALWVRQFARQELARREPAKVDAALAGLDDVQQPTDQQAYLALQPLWLQLATHRLQPQLLESLRRHSDARVRAAGLRVIGEQQAQLPEATSWLSAAVADEDDQVALEAICGLHRVGTLEAVRGVLAAAARPGKDQNLDFAIWNALRETESTWLPAFESGSLQVDQLGAMEALADAATTPAVARALVNQLAHQPAGQQARTVQLIAARGDAESLAGLAKWILDGPKDATEKAALLEILLTQSQARNLTPAAASEWLPPLLNSSTLTVAGQGALVAMLARAAEQWKVDQTSPTLERWLQQAIEAGRTPLLSPLMSSLAALGGDSGRQRIEQLAVQSELDLPTRSAAIAALSGFNPQIAAENVVQLYLSSPDNSTRATIMPDEVSAALTAILSRQPGAAAIQQAVSGTQASSWDAARARDFLATVRGSSQADEGLIATIVSATGLENAGWKMSAELSDRLVQMAQQSGDATHGQQIYRREKLQCVRCHAIGPSGVAVGPNLVSLGGSAAPDYIVESLINPGAKAKEGFQTLSVLLDSDEIINGLQQAKTDETLQLLLADGSLRSVSTDSIVAIRQGKSLMPDGLVDQLSERELVDLIAFLSKLGRDPDFTVDTRNWVRNWMTLQWSDAAHRQLNRTSHDSVTRDDPAFVWRLLASQVNGTAPLSEAAVFQVHQGVPRTVFLRFNIDCQQAGNVLFRFTQPTAGLTFWLDQDALPVPGPDQPLELSAGAHRITIGVSLDATDGEFGCEVLPAKSQPAVFKLQ